MTDYLEEHLGNAEALLEQIRQLEQSASGLRDKTVLKENVNKQDDFSEKRKEKSETASNTESEGYDTGIKENQIKRSVDNLDVDLEIHEKGQDIAVNRQKRADDNGRDLEQTETSSREEAAWTNVERAEKRPPLSAQLEELDRAVSALTALIPEERGSTQDGYSIALSVPQGLAVDPNITSVPGKAWSMPGAPAGADFAYGGTQSWAEQADRVFRRDSRRYDGGFYLY